MRISIPVTRRATKHSAVIQWVTRTKAECRERTVSTGTAEIDVGTQTESAICEIVAIRRRVEGNGRMQASCSEAESGAGAFLRNETVMTGEPLTPVTKSRDESISAQQAN